MHKSENFTLFNYKTLKKSHFLYKKMAKRHIPRCKEATLNIYIIPKYMHNGKIYRDGNIYNTDTGRDVQANGIIN